jgi:hypothetical protein
MASHGIGSTALLHCTRTLNGFIVLSVREVVMDHEERE